jgi:hypothetical protein
LKYSDTEYLVNYPTGKDGMYFRAYPIEVAGVSCVQVRFLGTAKGRADDEVKTPYQVVKYRLEDGGLVLAMLNTDLVSDELETLSELQAAFEKHKGDGELFDEPGRFRRVGPDRS